MMFIVALLLVYFLSAPGMYWILRTRLTASIGELVGAGFFFGFSLVVLASLGLSNIFPVFVTDIIIVSAAAVSLFCMVRELRRQNLPLWTASRAELIVVALALLFMLVSSFGDLANLIDDDYFIHFPNIKRIAMGDIPPHMPYFPDSLLRGHTGRDIFTGAIARFLGLRPELAIIYVTLAVCPAYILMFQSFASRLARGSKIATISCFIGLLFLISCAVGTSQIRAGCITYIFNNNQFAWGHAVFIGWLIVQVTSTFAKESLHKSSIAHQVRRNLSLIVISILSYTGLFFIYISNFLMYSLFLVCLPFLACFFGEDQRQGKTHLPLFLRSLIIVGGIVAASTILNILISPNLLERLLISLNIAHPQEPMYFIQQAHMTFPKTLPFTITGDNAREIPFFSREFLCAQGLSFYIGLAGVLIGLLWRSPNIFATSLFGWITMMWILLVDMGEYRADNLRLFVVAHMGFGACTGLIIGNGLEKLISSYPQRRIMIRAAAISSGVLMLWMARGNAEKFLASKHYLITDNVRRMSKIHRWNPEDWHSRLNMSRIDFDLFKVVAGFVKSPSERLLLKLAPDENFLKDRNPSHNITQIINAAFITGAGITGITQEHYMCVNLCPYDYRASLFWLEPSKDLLDELGPDWIIIDPTRLSQKTLQDVLLLPGVKLQRVFKDTAGRRRILLSYLKTQSSTPIGAGIGDISLLKNDILTSRFELVRLPVLIREALPCDKIKLALLVLDKNNQPINVADMPVVAVKPVKDESANRGYIYDLCFAMVHPGHFQVYFVDQATGKRMNQQALKVEVSDALAICNSVSPLPDIPDATKASLLNVQRTAERVVEASRK